MDTHGCAGYRSKLILSALACLGFIFGGSTVVAQETQTPLQARLASANWNITCTSDNTDSAFNCQMVRALVMGTNNVLVLRMSVSLPGNDAAPSLLLQMPHGMFLPAGVTLQIDDNTVQHEPVQTCDQSGCYVGAVIGEALLAALKKGLNLKISFQNLQKASVTVSMPLNGFTTGYEKIRAH